MTRFLLIPLLLLAGCRPGLDEPVAGRAATASVVTVPNPFRCPRAGR